MPNSVVQESRSCVVSVTADQQFIARSNSAVASDSSSMSSCGSRSHPWRLEAPIGQRINVSLLDFAPSRNKRSRDRDTDCQQYGYIIEKANKKNVSICPTAAAAAGGGKTQRENALYTSDTNTVDIIFAAAANAEQLNFLIKLNGWLDYWQVFSLAFGVHVENLTGLSNVPDNSLIIIVLGLLIAGLCIYTITACRLLRSVRQDFKCFQFRFLANEGSRNPHNLWIFLRNLVFVQNEISFGGTKNVNVPQSPAVWNYVFQQVGNAACALSKMQNQTISQINFDTVRKACWKRRHFS